MNYTREYFTSYPDKALVIYLSADTAGALDFTLRPTVPYEQSYAVMEGDGGSKTGTVTSSVANNVGTVELTGKLGYYDVDFMGLYKVYTDGGTVSASTTTHTYKDTAGVTHNDTDGTIVVSGAKSAYIVVTLGTDYELSEDVFTSGDSAKPTFNTDLTHTRAKVEGYMNDINTKLSGKSFAEAYKALKDSHVADHSELFGRVSLDLGCDEADFDVMTDDLYNSYKKGYESTYLETLIYQYGRYMLVASSRAGALPAHLQGAWNTYNIAPWASGYWHNINVQMNYWPAFSTNLAETFESYVELNEAYMKKAKSYADSVIGSVNPSEKDTPGQNGWTIGVGNTAYWISSDNSPGNTGYTTQLFWEYYNYTRDKEILKKTVLPVLLEAAKFITKCVHLTEDGKYLVIVSDSPEMFVNGVWYYTEGTTYAQTFAYLSNYYTLLAAEAAGVDLEGELGGEYEILKTVLEQIDKYDPINVGLSGQIKEFREEDYYGSVGDEPNHRHISQLVGLSPGNLINANTPAWLDAALVTLEGRSGADAHGWVFAHKINLYARAFDSESAYSMLNGFIEHCAPNLWSLYNDRIFQVEANFGTTAGITEMLMQSQNGYIELLPAIPNEWSEGSFTGLVAAGNFEVSAAWDSSLLKTVNITSAKGGAVSVKYPSIAGARVVSESGRAVSFSVTEKDVITFDTEIGETYIISGFESVELPDAPAILTYTRASFGSFKLACPTVEGAVGYNLYVAVENSPAYSLVEASADNYFVYTPTEENKNARTTFAVTAVGANGEESKRTLCYYNPEYTDAEIEELYASVLLSGALQVVVGDNGNAAEFRLWEKRPESEDFKLVDKSAYPILMAKSYSGDCVYAVSVVSGFDGKESEKRLVDGEYDPANVLLGKEFIPTPDTADDIYKWGSGYLGFDLLTDGKYTAETDGRYSSTKGGSANATLHLGATYVLSELRFHLYKGDVASAGIEDEFTVEISSGGEWITVFDGKTQSLADFKDGAYPYLVFDLGCRKVEKIRFKAKAASDKTVTFHEIFCSGVLAQSYKDEISNVLSGSFIPSDATAGNVYNSSYGFENLTDGIHNGESEGRFSSAKGKDVEATIDIEGKYALSELRIYLYKGEPIRAGKKLKIEVMIDGKWATAFEGGQAEIKNHLSDRYLSIDLGYAVAEKIRFFASSYDSSNTVTFYEIECSGFAIGESKEPSVSDNILVGSEANVELKSSFADNILLGKVFVPQSGANDHIYNNNENYGYSKLTDGSAGGRFSTKRGRDIPSGATAFDAIVDLGGAYELQSFKINYYSEASYVHEFFGTSVQIQAYYNGSWTTVKSMEGVESILAQDTVENGNWLDFDLSGVMAEKIRLTVPEVNCRTNNSRSISFHEIECSGTSIAEGSISPTHTPANAVDGNLDTYTEVSGTGSYTLEINLGRARKLTALGIYELIDGMNLIGGKRATASNSTTVEIFKNGSWTKIHSGVSLGDGETYFDMYGIETERVRITFNNTRCFDGENTPTAARILEVVCGAEADAIDLTLMKAALDKLPVSEPYGDCSVRYPLNDATRRFKAYALDLDATEGEIAAYTAEIEEYYEALGSVFLGAYNISLGTDIAVNFKYEALTDDTFIAYTDAYAEIKIISNSGEKTTKIYLKDAIKDDKGRYVITYHLLATEMADTVSVRIVLDEKRATEAFETSVREYADYLLAKPEIADAYPGISELLLAMLNYGGYAQSYFDHSTDKLASEGLYDIGSDPVLGNNSFDIPAVSTVGEASGASFEGWTLSLGSSVDMIIFFGLGEGAKISDYTVTAAEEGSLEALALRVVKIGGDYAVKLSGITASELDKTYTVTLTNKRDGSSASLSLCALSYAKGVMSDADATDSLERLLVAMKLYNDAANVYWQKNN